MFIHLSDYQEIAKLMADLKHCVALTGAGISAESGIATFRSKGGLWEKYDPMVYASIEAFREDPAKYWTIRGEFIRNTVLFGEQLPKAALETAYHQSATCKLMRVIGTSAVVQPAASLPALARQEGAKIVEVNIERAFAGADYVIKEKAAAGLSNILAEIRRINA